MRTRRMPWGTVASCLFCASLALPALGMSHGNGYVPGALCLMLGWVAAIVPWSANLALGAAALLRGTGCHRAACACALLAVALASTTQWFIVEFTVGAGFVAWISSMLALAFASTRSLAEQRELGRPLAVARALAVARTGQPGT